MFASRSSTSNRRHAQKLWFPSKDRQRQRRVGEYKQYETGVQDLLDHRCRHIKVSLAHADTKSLGHINSLGHTDLRSSRPESILAIDLSNDWCNLLHFWFCCPVQDASPDPSHIIRGPVNAVCIHTSSSAATRQSTTVKARSGETLTMKFWLCKSCIIRRAWCRSDLQIPKAGETVVNFMNELS